MNSKTAKWQSCNKDWSQVDCKLAKLQLCKEVYIKQIRWQMHKSRYNSELCKNRYDSSLGNCDKRSIKEEMQRRNSVNNNRWE